MGMPVKAFLRLSWAALTSAIWAFAIIMFLFPAHGTAAPVQQARQTVQLTAVTQPARHHAALSPGSAMLNWAETQTGKPYIWGGTGPWGYDCSGLVYAAALHIGITLPRTTYEMLGSWHLVPIPLSQARRGDLLFYGTGHVEFATMWHNVSFGAHDSGSTIGWIQWGTYWAPSMAFRVR